MEIQMHERHHSQMLELNQSHTQEMEQQAKAHREETRRIEKQHKQQLLELQEKLVYIAQKRNVDISLLTLSPHGYCKLGNVTIDASVPPEYINQYYSMPFFQNRQSLKPPIL